MPDNLIISNPTKLEEVKKTITEQGPGKLHVLSDFDRTLTYAFVDGKKRPSMISVLRDGDFLTPGYAQKAHALFDKYHPLEIDPHLPLAEKKKFMEEWWTSHFTLLIESGLNKKDIERVVSIDRVKLRDGAKELIQLLKSKSIPLLILSSSGLGGDAISLFFEKQGILNNNTHIISNFLIWNGKGEAIDYKKPVIHSMNKDETAISAFPKIYQEIKDRKNVILLGDSLGDIGMIQGFEYENIIKIGFLNENIESHLEHYKNLYDILILNDTSMGYITELLSQIL